jgi:mannose-6-phosphate isomerase-like protein (cupin superfamily)
MGSSSVVRLEWGSPLVSRETNFLAPDVRRNNWPMTESVDLADALATLDQPWQPLTVAVLNDYDVRVVKVSGEFTRHSHPETDELFLVLSGSLTIRMDDGDAVVNPGQVCVVPKGVPHQPFSPDGAEVVLIEPSATVNTGDTPSHLTTTPRRL